MAVTDLEVVHAYRHLQRAALRAVHFEKPDQYIVRRHIRAAFDKDSRDDFSPRKISRTLEFLDNAITVRGLEYKLTKNIVRVWGERERLQRSLTTSKIYPHRRAAYLDFDRTLRQLNETMELCIK
ncbi:hypothetical protein AMS68_007535 [Peltaster fructicola]|uniref:Uncharacterized protein n=1 Tax=Peltaster fructicola TaxID=286661 RepID=A0A6H0Y5A4_9PEZI|nr:hypothetical protein AMS68_007535 [Peltaster fructicola]